MIIRGVFLMSIINRLKSLFKGDIDKEETDINNDVSNTSNDVEVTSSQMEETVVPVEETNSEKDLTFKKDIEIVEDSSEEIVEEVETPEEAAPEEVEVVEEAAPEEPEVVEEVETAEDEEETTEDDVVEEVEEISNDKDKKRDTMTLLTDKELLTDSNRDPDFTAEFIDAGIETVKHCFQCGTCSGGCPSGKKNSL